MHTLILVSRTHKHWIEFSLECKLANAALDLFDRGLLLVEVKLFHLLVEVREALDKFGPFLLHERYNIIGNGFLSNELTILPIKEVSLLADNVYESA